jgi:uncharacterized membrane protein
MSLLLYSQESHYFVFLFVYQSSCKLPFHFCRTWIFICLQVALPTTALDERSPFLFLVCLCLLVIFITSELVVAFPTQFAWSVASNPMILPKPAFFFSTHCRQGSKRIFHVTDCFLTASSLWGGVCCPLILTAQTFTLLHETRVFETASPFGIVPSLLHQKSWYGG